MRFSAYAWCPYRKCRRAKFGVRKCNLRLGFVVSNTHDTIVLDDPGAHSQCVGDALDEGAALLILEAHRQGSVTATGIWSGNPVVAGGETAFSDAAHRHHPIAAAERLVRLGLADVRAPCEGSQFREAEC